ncbi:MAG: hypothetical protein J6T10_18730 [Methanobrevibacter sp.]|nr:hypothetical protein [Methanobrevibacter sp.]
MQRNSLPPIQSSFLSCEKDTELILNRLFIDGKQYSRWLKRLLIINNKDCLDKNITKYDDIVDKFSVSDLIDKQYIRTTPRLELNEHEDVQSYILLNFDNFTTNSVNNQFRDCIINFDIICHTKQWDLNDLRVRPLMIAGYIDGILNLGKLSGVGETVFLGCNELILDQNLAGYTLSYQVVHFSEDDAKLEALASQ